MKFAACAADMADVDWQFNTGRGRRDNVEASQGLGVALIVFHQPPAPPRAAVLFQG